jgi:hypothetical protein
MALSVQVQLPFNVRGSNEIYRYDIWRFINNILIFRFIALMRTVYHVPYM